LFVASAHRRFWHKADISQRFAMSAFGGKADIACWMTQSGHAHSALDPFQAAGLTRYDPYPHRVKAVKRREFITLLSGAAACPLAARGEQSSPPVIGFLDPRSLEGVANRLRGLRQGLKETGFIEGENVTIEYRWADNQIDKLPELAADLVRRHPAVIIASGGHDPALATKAATTTIPILFLVAEDPVALGLVTSLARPGGHLTGINIFTAELTTKRLELLHELVPQAKRIAVLINPVDATNADATVRAIEPAAIAIGPQVRILTASTGRTPSS
jgi:putative ABC transport system substrate-binding protein